MYRFRIGVTIYLIDKIDVNRKKPILIRFCFGFFVCWVRMIPRGLSVKSKKYIKEINVTQSWHGLGEEIGTKRCSGMIATIFAYNNCLLSLIVFFFVINQTYFALRQFDVTYSTHYMIIGSHSTFLSTHSFDQNLDFGFDHVSKQFPLYQVFCIVTFVSQTDSFLYFFCIALVIQLLRNFINKNQSKLNEFDVFLYASYKSSYYRC